METGAEIWKVSRKGFMRLLEEAILEIFLFRMNGYEGFSFLMMFSFVLVHLFVC